MLSFDYIPVPADAGMEIAGIFLLFLFGIYLLMFAFMVLSYVLQSVGLYAIAKRRCIRKPWLAWIPVGNMWILGSISDQYQYVVKGRVLNRRKWLAGLTVATMISATPLPVVSFIMLAQGNSGNPGSAVMLSVMLSFLLVTVMAIVAIVAMVLEYIALYDLYVSCDPNNAVMYLVLSIFINVTVSFFIFACRKKDLGMPPRKTVEPVQQVLAEPVQQMPAEEPASAEEGSVPAEVSASEAEPVEEATEE